MIIVFLLGFIFLTLQTFNDANQMLVAVADTVKTPEGIYYKGTPDADQQTPNKLKESVDNVREKLNLDQQPPAATKEFLESVQTKVEETLKPFNGTRRGYYQENVPETEIQTKK
jgi:hypothetical protein